MLRISAVLAFVLLAALIPLGLRGQAPSQPAPQPQPAPQQKKEKTLPALAAKCEAVNDRFVKGQRVQVNCSLMFSEGVILALDDLKNSGNENFAVVEFSATEPVPVPDQKDYNLIIVTVVLRPDEKLNYGNHAVKLKVGYSYPESSWVTEKDDKKKLKTNVVQKNEQIPDIIFEKSPLVVELDLGEGFQDVVNIGEHIEYRLRVFYEKNAVTVLNTAFNPVGLDRKFQIRDAANLDNPDLKPFAVINKDDAGKIQEKDRGSYKELVCHYRLALYEVSMVKMFEIPPLNIYYIVKGDTVPAKTQTQTLKIRTNSVLNRDSDFRPLKNTLGPNPEKLKYYGTWPMRVAYGLAGLAALLICWLIVSLMIRLIKKIYRTGLRESLALLRKTILAKINGLSYVAKLNAKRALSDLVQKPNQDNLKKFIIKLRLYMAVRAKVMQELALSFTTAQFGLKINADALENAEYLLDEEISQEDLRVLNQKFTELCSKKTTRR